MGTAFISDPYVAMSPPDRASWKEVFTTTTLLRVALIGVLHLLVYGETLNHEVVRRWIQEDNWSHGWLIPLFSIYALYTQREALARVQPTTNWLGALVVIASLALFFYSAWVVPRAYPRALSLVGTIFGLTLLLGGWPVIRIAWFPILFLALAIPLPDRLYVTLTMPMRAFASKAAAALLPWFVSGLFAEAQSVVIDYMLPGRAPAQLNVEEACSGMRSLMALVTLGLAMAFLGDRPLWQRLILVASCLPIALLCNILRVLITGVLIIKGHADLARGTPHSMLGVAVFGIALGLYMLLGFAMSRLFVSEETAPSPVRERA